MERSLMLVNPKQKNIMSEFTYQCLEKARWKAMDEYEINAVILGLRVEESRGRRINYFLRGDEYYNRREKNVVLQPLGLWSVKDVFFYMALENIPKHPVYNKLKKFKEKKQIRLNTPLTLDFTSEGDIGILKHVYPKTFNRYAEILPHIRDYL
jgi:3'-phosphoadenosine 5'-phosphosulfate sulfotransferase (PAPS reductase)/FAD synthetase